MYRIIISAKSINKRWIDGFAEIFGEYVEENNGKILGYEDKGRFYKEFKLDVSAEAAKNEVRNALVTFYTTFVKSEYLSRRIVRYAKSDYLVQIYIKILSSFNLSDETAKLFELMSEIYENFCLDGFYEFRMGAIIEGWEKLVGLSRDNSDLIRDEQSFATLLRYMLSCLPSRSDSVSIDFCDDKFLIKSDKISKSFNSPDDVIFALIDLAPNKVYLSAAAGKTRIDEKIFGIFDAVYV